MAGRIVLFGATGYTGRLVAGELAARGLPALLAGRSLERLEELASQLDGDFDIAEARVDDASSITALLGRRDILISTVGPFLRLGDTAISAAIRRRANYIDSTGEPPFIRRVFEEYGPAAESAGVVLLPAFGYDYVPGNVAGGLALERAGAAAARVDIGYFTSGGGFSTGTVTSLLGAARHPQFAWRGGRIVTERGGARTMRFSVRGSSAAALSVGGTEHFALPAAYPSVEDVGVYLGWFGALTPVVHRVGAAQAVMTRIPGASAVIDQAVKLLPRGAPGEGPDATQRERTRSTVIAVARTAGGDDLAKVRLAGVDPYTLTARLLAWAAQQLERGERPAPGARGPLDAFGLMPTLDALGAAGLSPKRG
ncbi:MAG: saccharopine dehydrogenase family protein [Candidatus Dormibacteria bacterium]